MATGGTRTISTAKADESVLLLAPSGTLVSLVGASQRDVDAVTRLLAAGRVPTDNSPVPHIRVTFEHELGRDPANAIEWRSMADRVWELRAERGSGRVTHLKPLVRLSALAMGALPLHAAAAVNREGGAVILAGPAGSGKTRLLLALLDQGWSLLAGEWIVIRAGEVMSAGETVDLRAEHLADLGSLRPQLSVANRIRLALARLPLGGRIDRFELRADQLGAHRMAPGTSLQIARMLWCVGGVEHPRVGPSQLDTVLDELVADQLWRYSELLRLHERAVTGGAEPSRVLHQLGELFRRRTVESLAAIRVDVIEHAPRLSLADLGGLATGIGASVG